MGDSAIWAIVENIVEVGLIKMYVVFWSGQANKQEPISFCSDKMKFRSLSETN